MTKEKDFDFLVFIGRFQLPHHGHFNIIEKALDRACHVIVLVGSSNVARSPRNPFTFEEREVMLTHLGPSKVYDAYADNRITFKPLNDHTYRDQDWLEEVQNTVASMTSPGDRIGLIGHATDHTSYYLKLFPQWESVDVPDMHEFHSTDLRQFLFEGWSQKHWETATHAEVMEYGKEILNANSHLYDEYNWILKYKQQWSNTPYPVTLNTVDAVVVQSGHILLVKRGAMPGKGMWALPGGYINQNETLKQSMLRELDEETKIRVPNIEQYIERSETFDDPNRSLRGRVITTAFLLKLPNAKSLPKVKGSDDAVKAKWIPLADLKANELFEDHYHIIRKMTSGL